jgi:CSLREA domain-containing protein
MFIVLIRGIMHIALRHVHIRFCLILTAALVLLIYSKPALAATYTVTTTADSGGGSLRAAINSVNSTPGTDTINFNIPGGGVHTIYPQTPLPEITAPVIINGTSQPGYSGAPLIELNGSQAWSVTGVADGLVVSGGSSTIRGLALNRFSGSAIKLMTGGGSTVIACYIGTDASGMSAPSTDFQRNGVMIESSANNTIGGTAAGAGNVISGYYLSGLVVTGLGSTGNKIQGNKIGTNAAGTAALPSRRGILVTAMEFTGDMPIYQPSSSTLIGGTVAGARNLISGNSEHGILIDKKAYNTTIQGNWIGTDITGNSAIPNDTGILFASTAGTPNLVGGTAAGAGNLISGNTNYGVTMMTGPGTIQGNIVGLNASGTAALGNQYGIGAGKGVLVGGTTAGAGNTVAGNTLVGISVGQQDAIIQGNFVGTNTAGTLDLGVQAIGIDVWGNYSTIGGTAPGEGNLVAHNAGTGILVNSNDFNADFFIHNSILGNRIYANDDPGDPARGLGIDLRPIRGGFGVTPNDVSDNDIGGNTLQNYPVMLVAATNEATQEIRIVGTLNSAPNKTYRLDFYVNDSCDASGYGEGQTFLGTSMVSVPANGTAWIGGHFSRRVPPGKIITSTVTSPTNDTSEFSACLAAVAVESGQTLVVNSADDVSDGVCNAAHCSLREAILFTHVMLGPIQISFNIPGSGSHTIQPTTPLPPFGNIILDGTTQPGYTGSPLIILNGSNLTVPVADRIGLILEGGNTTVRGFVINGFAGGGIYISTYNSRFNHIEGNYIGTDVTGMNAVANGYGIKISNQSGNNVVGGSTASARNIISGNTGDGIVISGDLSSYNVVSGNYIGTDVTGMTALKNNGYGIRLDSRGNLIGGVAESSRNVILNGILIGSYYSNQIQGNYIGTNATGTAALLAGSKGITIQNSANNLIGGTAPGAGNVISGNQDGITITGATATGNQVQGNFIGTNAAGTAAIPNTGSGIHVTNGALNTQIGGAEVGARNIISGNTLAGVRTNFGTTGTVIQNNYIGTDVSGANPIPNLFTGVYLAFNSRATIGGVAPGQGNRIAFNMVNGIGTDDYVGGTITGNSIFRNDLLGIDLGSDGVTPNDPANYFQNAPVLTEVTSDNAILYLSGTLSSLPSKTFQIEFFANDSCDVSGFGEAQVFLGAQSVLTDATGKAMFNAQISAVILLGQSITATATSPDGNTSEFSACFLVVSEPGVAPVRNYFTSRDITLTWRPLSWAQAYHVQVSMDPTFSLSVPIVDNSNITDTSLDISAPSNGVYYWRVRAKKPDNSWGNWGMIEAITVGEN